MASHKKRPSSIFAAAIFMIASAAFARSQTPDAVRKPTGSISGRVTVGGKPAASVLVAAVAGETINRPDATARTTTDSDGHYVLSGLAAGQYQVWTITPNMVADAVANPGYYPYYGASKSVNLESDEQVANIDLRLLRGSVITGRVTNADNKPVIGETITVQSLDRNGNPGYPIGGSYDEKYQTDDRGIYRIFGLPPGRFRVSAGADPDMAPFRRERRYEKAFYLDPADQSRPGIVELKQGDVAESIDIRVQPAPSTYSVSGRVIDADTGAPVAKSGVLFRVISKDSRSRPANGTQANEQGEFNFSSLAPGHYTVTPTAEFYGGNFYGDPVEFEVIDKDITGIEVKTVPGLSLSGVVVAEGLSNKELLAMLPGLMVMASSPRPNGQERNSGRATVAADGSFQIGGLRPGKMMVFANTQGPPYRTVSIHLEHEGAILAQDFDLQRSMSGLRIAIEYGTGTLRGTIKFAGDLTTDFSRIHILCRREGGRDDYEAPIDTRGHFQIGDLAPGTYEVTMQVARLSNDPSRPIFQKQTVNITNGQETEVTFTIDLTARP